MFLKSLAVCVCFLLAVVAVARGADAASDGPCQSFDQLHAEAELARDAGKLEDARLLLEQALRCYAYPGLLRVRLFNDLGGVAEMQYRYGDAEQAFRQALELNRSLPHPSQADLASSLSNLGSIAERKREYAVSEDLLRQAHGLLQKEDGLESRLGGIVSSNLALTLMKRGKLQESGELIQFALRTLAASGDADAYAVALSNAALLALEKGDYAGAVESSERALAIESKRSEDARQRSIFMSNLGVALFRLGRIPEAEATLKSSLTLSREAWGRLNATSLETLNNLAILERSRGQLSNAEEYAQTAHDIASRELGKDDPALAGIWTTQAAIALSRNNLKEAERLYRSAAALWEKASGTTGVNYAAALANLAEVESRRRQYDKARALYERGLAIDQSHYGDSHPRIAEDLNNIAAQSFYRKDFGTAADLLERAEKIQLAVFGPDHPKTAHSAHNLAVVYANDQRLDDAAAAYRRAIQGFDHYAKDDAALIPWLNEYAGLLRRMQQFAQSEQVSVRALGLQVRRTLAAERNSQAGTQGRESFVKSFAAVP